MKNWLTKNKYVAIGEFFIWFVPLVLLVILACESKNAKVGLKLWGSVVGAIVILVYFVGLRKWVNKKVEFEKHEQLRVPLWLRLIQMVVTLICFGVVIAFIYAINDMFKEILTFVVCSACSVFIGYIFLLIDSKTRKAQKIIRQSEE